MSFLKCSLFPRRPSFGALDGHEENRPRSNGLPSSFTSPWMARRLEVACSMLHYRSLGLKEIAHACGFCDVFHFSKRFKQGIRLNTGRHRPVPSAGQDARRKMLGGIVLFGRSPEQSFRIPVQDVVPGIIADLRKEHVPAA